jgi:hypothetical protein
MSPQLPPSETRTSFDPSMESGSRHTPLSVLSAHKEEPKVETDEDGLTDEDILVEAHEYFTAVASWEQPFRERARQEFEFVDGLKHWDAQMLEERRGRPCLVFDRIGPAVDQVVNDARQSPPEPRISPVGEGADKETAEVLQGLVRNIDNDSNARVVWATGYEHAVKCGRGWVRVLTVWEEDDSFKQKIVLRRVANPFTVYPDPSADEFDYSDMRRCMVTEDLDTQVYKETYPDSKVASLFDFQSVGDQIRKDWFPTGSVRTAEFWKVLTKRGRLAQLEDGQIKREDEITEQDRVRAWRPTTKKTVKGYKLNGVEILDRWTWPGKWIPIVPIIGREVIVEGKRTVRGMVRPAMDANLSYDFMRSKEAEAIGLAPISQWLVAKNQIENYAAKWANCNRVAQAYLEYDPQVQDTGTGPIPVPPPQRISPAVNTQDITQAIAHAADDIRATTSMYRPDMGESQPDQSGRAILAIQRQGDNAHFNYHDNLAISQMHVLRILVDLAPKIYDEERLETVFDPDGSVRQVWLNKKHTDNKGVDRIYDIKSAARYDVTLGSGPSYASRRAQAQEQLFQLYQAMPQAMTRALDLILKTFDVPGIDEIADRLRPPDVAQQQEGQAPVPPQVQQQIVQMQQLLQAMNTQMTAQAEELKTQRIQNESKERIAAGNNATQLAIADLKLGSDQALQMFQSQYAAINQKIDQVYQLQAQRDEQQHQKELSDQQHQQQLQQQGQQQQADAQQAAQAQQQPAAAGAPPASEPMPQAA